MARWWRVGTARNPRVLTTAPFAPEVVPDVKPTIIGAPGSMPVSTCGDACCASSHERQPVASGSLYHAAHGLATYHTRRYNGKTEPAVAGK